MAGEPKPQTTATAPDVSQAAPSAPLTTTGSQDTPKASPPTPTPPGPEQAKAPQQKQEPQRKEKPRPEPKRNSPVGPEPTAHKTEAELDAMLQAFEKGEPKEDGPTETQKKATTAKPAAKAAAKADETDPLQKELDEANKVAAEAAGLKLAPKPEESTEQDKDRDAPDEAKDEFQSWLDTLPKGAKEKITRQQKQIRELRGQAAEQFKLTPTHANPLAHVESEAQLQAEDSHWRTVQSECQRLIRNGMTDDGQGEITLANGKKHMFESLEEVQQSLDWANEVRNAIPDWKERLNDRSKGQPWEAAVKLAPDLFEKGSPSHDLALDVLTNVPAFKAAFPDYEVRLAHMARSMKMEEDQKPTKEFPHGKAKYVRLELDSEGRVIQPKAKAKEVVVPNTKPVTESVKETAPSIAKPALKVAVSGDDVRALQAKYEKSRNEDDLDALLRASERAA